MGKILKVVSTVSVFIVGWNLLFILANHIVTISLMPILVYGIYTLYILGIIALIAAYKKGFAILDSGTDLSPKRQALYLAVAYLIALIASEIINWIYYQYLDPAKGLGEEIEHGGISYLLLIIQYLLLPCVIYFLAHRKALKKK